MNSAKRSFQVAQSCVRQITTAQTQKAAGAAADVPIGYSKLKIKQDKFQVKDGQLVFLKGGMLDKVMYQGTMALSLLGVGLVCKLIYDLAMPAKPE